MTFLRPNIDGRGRAVRAAGGLALLAGAVVAWSASAAAGLGLAAASAFVLFEAARGWCALRACGVKTRL